MARREEWVFSLAGTTTDGERKRVELRTQGVAEEPDDPLLQDQEVSSIVDAETASLLGSSDASLPTVGWRFSSSFWTLTSKTLLTLTHRPAWQALPDFTSSRNCGLAYCCSIEPQIDYISEAYTTEDIVETKYCRVHIRGQGMCQALQLILKRVTIETSPVPERYRTALEKHRRQQQDQPPLEYSRFSKPADDLEFDMDDGTIRLTFAMPETTDCKGSGPPLFWKMQMKADPNLALETWTVLDGFLHSETKESSPTHMYVNGYESWSYAGSVPKGKKQPQSAMPDLFSRAFNAGGSPPPPAELITTPATARVYGRDPTLPRAKKYSYQSDFFACISSDQQTPSAKVTRIPTTNVYPSPKLDESGGPALILGWLSQHEHLGVIQVDSELKQVLMHASSKGGQMMKSGAMVETDWAYVQLVAPHHYDEEPLVHYLHAVAAYNEAKPLQNGPLLTGWCSWYHYYEHISAGNLRENFHNLARMRNKVPTNVSVVDDGYMTAWGDWDSLKPKNFPGADGLDAVARDIRACGMRPGLWLAPFTCDKHSRIAEEHPSWIIGNFAGIPANSANCGKFFYGLDATNPHVRKHVYDSIRRAVDDWGYEILKIDFLYAACLEGNGKYDLSMSRAQAMHLALQTIREAAGPNVFLIGCGCPIGTGIGYVDGMRISADTGPTWYPAFPFPKWDQGTLPSLRGMIRNSITRAPMGHRFWHNDPDCLLLGESTSLSNIEVASAASIIAVTCGMLLLSDDLTKVSTERMSILTKIFPMTGASAVVLDLHSTEDGLPCLLRLWCTDKYNMVESFRSSRELNEDQEQDHNAEASFFGRRASFNMNEPQAQPNERKRNCIHVAKGLGTWTLLSVSNWRDSDATVHVPKPAMALPPTEGWGSGALSENDGSTSERHHGYHVFAFWSSKYTWIPDKREGEDAHLSRRLKRHETEIFHIRPVTLDLPQYIGSDLHFSCGHEVHSLRKTSNSFMVFLKTQYKRVGHVFVFIPRVNTDQVRVKVNGKPSSSWNAVANTPHTLGNGRPSCAGRILRIPVVIDGTGKQFDGQIHIDF